MARPRKPPEGTTASERASMARERLRAEGGASKNFRLSARAIENLAIIRDLARDASDTAVIERLLEEERTRLLSSGSS
ncbi:hypothetical protein GAY28_36260 [Azospirillum brasilense]|nr:hypothetical protein [Azospirillum brasilense]